MKAQEESRHTNKEIKMYMNAFLGAPYDMELHGPDGPYISTDKTELEEALMIEYENKCRLASSSQFLHEPLVS